MTAANRLRDVDKDCWYDDELSPLPYFSKPILDDEQIMLQFLKVTGYFLKWCSERLRSNERMVNAAVATCPRAVEFSLGEIREELTSNTEFMMSVIRDDGGGAMLVYAPSEMQRDKNIVLEAVANWLKHRQVTDCLRSDPEIALKSLERWGTELSDLDESVQMTRSFALAAVRVNGDIFCQLPGEFQEDEQIALQALKHAGKFWLPWQTVHAIVQQHPSLLRSREVMVALAGMESLPTTDLFKLVAGHPPMDNKEFILAACQKDYNVLEHCSGRFCADHDVVLAALEAYHREDRNWSWQTFPLCHTTAAFQLANIDVVLKAIAVVKRGDRDELLNSMPAGVWSHRSVVLACLERRWPVVARLSGARSAFRNDRDLLKMAVKNDWSEFQHIPLSLKSDREFVLAMVQIDGRVLSHAEDDLKHDYEILTAAVASKSVTIAACFSGDGDDFDFLVSYAQYVRGKLKLFDVFVCEFLRGILTTETHVAPAKRCRLPMLDQGVETTIVFKRTIAQFLGVPLGKELHLLRAASPGLAEYGY